MIPGLLLIIAVLQLTDRLTAKTAVHGCPPIVGRYHGKHVIALLGSCWRASNVGCNGSHYLQSWKSYGLASWCNTLIIFKYNHEQKYIGSDHRSAGLKLTASAGHGDIAVRSRQENIHVNRWSLPAAGWTGDRLIMKRRNAHADSQQKHLQTCPGWMPVDGLPNYNAGTLDFIAAGQNVILGGSPERETHIAMDWHQGVRGGSVLFIPSPSYWRRSGNAVTRTLHSLELKFEKYDLVIRWVRLCLIWQTGSEMLFNHISLRTGLNDHHHVQSLFDKWTTPLVKTV